MSSNRVLVIMGVFLLLLHAAWAIKDVPAELLSPGVFHGDEVISKTGEPWLALTVDRDRAALVPVTLKVEPAYDAVLDDEAKGETTGKCVSASESVPAIRFFVRGIPSLIPGPVESLAASGELKPNTPLAFRLKQGSDCSLECVCQRPPEKDGAFGCQLILRMGSVEQTLATDTITVSSGSVFLGDDASWKLLWAGDLNHDGITDLIIDLTNHYNLQAPTLFLSEGKPEKPTLRRVASHRSVGC